MTAQVTEYSAASVTKTSPHGGACRLGLLGNMARRGLVAMCTAVAAALLVPAASAADGENDRVHTESRARTTSGADRRRRRRRGGGTHQLQVAESPDGERILYMYVDFDVLDPAAPVFWHANLDGTDVAEVPITGAEFAEDTGLALPVWIPAAGFKSNTTARPSQRSDRPATTALRQGSPTSARAMIQRWIWFVPS